MQIKCIVITDGLQPVSRVPTYGCNEWIVYSLMVAWNEYCTHNARSKYCTHWWLEPVSSGTHWRLKLVSIVSTGCNGCSVFPSCHWLAVIYHSCAWDAADVKASVPQKHSPSFSRKQKLTRYFLFGSTNTLWDVWRLTELPNSCASTHDLSWTYYISGFCK